MNYQQAWEELKEWLSRSQEIVKEFKDDKSIENNRYFILRLNEKLKTMKMINRKIDQLEKIHIDDGGCKLIVSPELEYFSNNFDEICCKYDGRWIAIKGDKIVGHGDTLHKACEMARNNGYEKYVTTRANRDGWNCDYVSMLG